MLCKGKSGFRFEFLCTTTYYCCMLNAPYVTRKRTWDATWHPVMKVILLLRDCISLPSRPRGYNAIGKQQKFVLILIENKVNI